MSAIEHLAGPSAAGVLGGWEPSAQGCPEPLPIQSRVCWGCAVQPALPRALALQQEWGLLVQSTGVCLHCYGVRFRGCDRLTMLVSTPLV